jgi:hypothetical protein
MLALRDSDQDCLFRFLPTCTFAALATLLVPNPQEINAGIEDFFLPLNLQCRGFFIISCESFNFREVTLSRPCKLVNATAVHSVSFLPMLAHTIPAVEKMALNYLQTVAAPPETRKSALLCIHIKNRWRMFLCEIGGIFWGRISALVSIMRANRLPRLRSHKRGHCFLYRDQCGRGESVDVRMI